MLIPFREIQRRVQAKIQNTNTSTSDDNSILPKIKDWINERYHRIYRIYPWSDLVDTYNLSITASTSEYCLDRSVAAILSIYDSTNGLLVDEIDRQYYNRFIAPDFEQDNNQFVVDSTKYIILGKRPVKAAISSAERISVVSSSVSDITPNCVSIIGIVSGVEMSENIVLTGTTAAVSVNTYDASQKLIILTGTSNGTRKTTVGKVTVSGYTSSTVYSQISPTEFCHEYLWIKVAPTPTASATQPTWAITYLKPLQYLSSDNDIPLFDCCSELVQGAYSDALREDGQEEQANIAEQKFIDMVNELKTTQKSVNKKEQFIPYQKGPIKILDFGRAVR